jgi:hypothetical protein
MPPKKRGTDMKLNHAILYAALVAGLGAGAPAQADPPPWAPAHGHRAKQEREYRYVYYPAQQVYYAPDQQVWFWMNGGNWQVGVNLPMQYRSGAGSGVQVVLNSERPYVEHAYVEEHYGRPWRKEHGGHGHHDH